MNEGATFNADPSSSTKGWDDPKSPYLYYGGGAVVLKDGHLEFTAKGANATDEATLYWFSINSNVAFPQDPGEEPVKPTAPTAPTALKNLKSKMFQLKRKFLFRRLVHFTR